MSEPKTGSFVAVAAANRAAFISYREVMTKLAADTHEPLNEIAAVLKTKGLHKKHTSCVYGVEQAAGRITDAGPIVALLDATIERGTIDPASYAFEEPDADSDRFGWERQPFGLALANAGLPCPESLLDAQGMRARFT